MSQGNGSPTLRFGVAGLGVAFNFLMSSIEGRSHLRLAAACDVRPRALERFETDFGGKTYSDFAQMCADPNVDVVYIMTPNQFHCQQAVIAAEHRKHVIVDKPFALTLAECDAMNAAAERNGVLLLCGSLHSYGPAVRKMRELVTSGTLGTLRMINTWHFNDWLYRPRAAWELEPGGGGNLIFNQGPHQVDIVRALGGGLVHSVRAATGVWDSNRPIEGAYTAYLEFQNGVVATLVYSGYAHFDTAELTEWAGEGIRTPEANLGARRRLAALANRQAEETAKEGWRYGSPDAARFARTHPLILYGLTVVSCDRGDIRQSPDGLLVYGDEQRWSVAVEPNTNQSNGALENLYEHLYRGRPILRGGRWGQATMEVVLAIIESDRQKKEIYLNQQVAAAE